MTLNRVLLIALLASVASASSSSTFSVTLSPPAGTSESAVLTAITFRAYERWDGTEKGWSAIDSPPHHPGRFLLPPTPPAARREGRVDGLAIALRTICRRENSHVQYQAC